MQGNSFEDVVVKRRSVRRYTEQPVPRELLLELVDTATQAPSNFNRQPWRFIVLDSPEWVSAVVDILHRGCQKVEAEDADGGMYNMVDHIRSWLYPLEGSAAIILCFYKPSPERIDEQIANALSTDDISLYNPNLITLGMAIQNLLLAATAKGLGACMHSGPLPFLRGPLNKALGLPAKLQLAGMVSLGWPDENPERPKHKALEKVMSFAEGDVPDAVKAIWNDADVGDHS